MPGAKNGPETATPNGDELVGRLQAIYGRRRADRDVFGRRPALPSEVEKVINSGWTGDGRKDSAR